VEDPQACYADRLMSPEHQLELLCRGAVDLHVRSELEARLLAKKRLRVKAGFDPTRPDLHLGHTVLMQKMRQFQELGHEVVFVIGDFTAMLGDPTGRNELRPHLTREEVSAAAETYQAQAFKVLDPSETVVRYNSEWLEGLDASAMIKLSAQTTVARMLERDDFAKRYAEGRPIHIHEFLYPLLQAYDSVVLDCDIELGGTDQLFNLMVGRDLMPRYGLKPQMVMTMPILEGLDARLENGKVVGAKMSKSANNYIGITEPAAEMLQKLMLVDDAVLWRYMELLSSQSTEAIKAQRAAVLSGETNVIEVKERFAEEIITRFHSVEAAQAARARRHSIATGGVPEDVEERRVQADGDTLWLAKALALAGLTKSSSEAKRLIQSGAVQVDGAPMSDERHTLRRGQRALVRVGHKNKRFCYLVVT
jgi:tyrosyl-tRNA synthetase